MSITEFIDTSIYVALAAVALAGLWFFLLLFFRIKQKRFSSDAAADTFLDSVNEHLARKDFSAVAELCDSPPYWSKAVPQLILVAIQNRDQPPPKIRKQLAERFERDVLADMEYRLSWIGTVVKAAPMLGLQGTVVGMINAFAKLASSSQKTGTDPSLLANDISFALYTTAIGLMIAIPLVLVSNFLQIRIGKLQDSVQHDLGRFLEPFEKAISEPRR